MIHKITSPADVTIATLRRLTSEANRQAEYDMTVPCTRRIHDAILDCLDEASDCDVRSILDSGELKDLRKDLLLLNSRFHSTTEKTLALHYLRSGNDCNPFDGSWINRGFTDLLTHQVAQWRAANIIDRIKEQLVVVVGGGALPQTQVWLYNQLKCEVLSVDFDEQSASLCEDVLKKLGHTHLKVHCAAGEDFDYTDASIVVVATLVANKLGIAKQVAATSNDSYFAPRIPVGMHAMWREPVDVGRMSQLGWEKTSELIPEGSSVGSLLFSPAR